MYLIGTSFFPSRMAAIRYFKPYGFDAAAVERKLLDGEIHIGKPTLQPGDKLLTVDCGLRYAIARKD